MSRTGAIAAAFVPVMVLSLGLRAPAAEIPAPKLALIRQAMASMKLDARVRGLVAARVEARLQAIRAANPGLSDSLAAAARTAVASAYEDGLEGPDGLFPRVYGVLDRRLGDDDLRFVIDFHGSDQGRRYKEMVPRIVAESVEEGRRWAEGREVEVRARLDAALRGTDVKY
jgi:hypothetical protein